jgi:hypothetical protein
MRAFRGLVNARSLCIAKEFLNAALINAIKRKSDNRRGGSQRVGRSSGRSGIPRRARARQIYSRAVALFADSSDHSIARVAAAPPF